MTKKIQFHNRFCFGFFFCVSSVTDSVNRIILHQERFIDSLKERKKPLLIAQYIPTWRRRGLLGVGPCTNTAWYCVSSWCRTGNRWPSVDVVHTNTMKLYASAMKLKTNNQYGDIKDVGIHNCDQLYIKYKRFALFCISFQQLLMAILYCSLISLYPSVCVIYLFRLLSKS